MKHQENHPRRELWIIPFLFVPLLLFTHCTKEAGVEPGVEPVEEGCIGPTYSIQGKIVFTSCCDGESSLYTLEDNVTTEILKKERHLDRTHPRWSPDGKYIAYHLSIDTWDEKGDFNRQHFISVIHPDGTEFTTLAPQYEGNGGFLFPSWSPGGDQIAYCHPEEDGFSIRVVALDATEEKVIGHFNGNVSGFDWSPDGSRFVILYEPSFMNDSIMILDSQGAILRNLKAWDCTHNAVNGQIRWSPNGAKTLFTGGCLLEPPWVVMMDANLSAPEFIGVNEKSSYAAWSPDGKHIVCLSRKSKGWKPGYGTSYCWYLSTMDLNGNDKKKISSYHGRYLDWTGL